MLPCLLDMAQHVVTDLRRQKEPECDAVSLLPQPELPDISIPAEAEARVVPTEVAHHLGRPTVKRRNGSHTDDAQQPLLAADGATGNGASSDHAEAV